VLTKGLIDLGGPISSFSDSDGYSRVPDNYVPPPPPVDYLEDFNFEAMANVNEEAFAKLNKAAKTADIIGKIVSISLSICCTACCLNCIYKRWFKKDKQVMVKEKAAVILVEEAAYDANELIRNRKDADEKSIEEDQEKTLIGEDTTVKETPRQPRKDDEVSLNATSDHVSKQIDKAFKDHEMMNPQEVASASTRAPTNDPMLMTMMRLM
jgi:hypothetical protein